MNRLELHASILSAEPLRYTPGGTAVQKMLLQHASTQIEADIPRLVELQLQAVALGKLAQSMAGLSPGVTLSVQGFLAPLRKGSARLVFHITRFSPAQNTPE